jgi:Putative esterase
LARRLSFWMWRCASWIVLLAATITVLASTLLAQASGLRFEISFPKEASATALDGRVLLLISTNDNDEPRFQIEENFAQSQQAFGVDVDGLAPGAPAVIDASAFGYPTRSLANLPAGEYYVEALLNIYETFHLGDGHTVKLPPDKGEGQHWQTKPGNLYSKPVKMRIDPKSNQVIRISLNEKVPVIDQELDKVDSLLDWGRGQGAPVEDNKWVKHIRIESKLLTKFWGRPTYLGAVVLLPDGFDQHPNAQFPLVVEQDHYHRDLFLPVGFRTEPPTPDLKDSAKMSAQYAYKFHQDWTSGRLPRVIMMTIQHPTPYFDDSYAVNSESQGPYGDAITSELIPYIEKKFRAIPEGWAHVVYGGSTGGWEALASQVFYPDLYNGAWVFCPDVVDFRAYSTANLYSDNNAYFVEGFFGRVPRPEMRERDGLVLATMESANHYELVLGTHGRSGEQFDIWQATFSPMGADGYPKPIFNKLTGEINHDVANYWKEHYDLSAIMQRDWKTLGPKLAGKMHFYVGEADTWYLDRAVHLLHDFLETTKDPYYHGTFDFGVREPHCYAGAGDSSGPPTFTIPQRFLPAMVKHMEETAPKGADLNSWKY